MEFKYLNLKNINEFFTLKYKYKGEELIKQVESFRKTDKELSSKDFLSFFKKKDAEDFPKDDNTKAVSVWFPLDDKGEPIFSINFLKGAACYPWELDPIKDNWLMICNKKHIPLQLAQASYYGVFRGKLDLRTLIGQTNRLPYSDPLLGIHIKYPKLRKYRFPISLDFEPKEDYEAEEYDFETMEDKDFFELCRDLLRIQSNGFGQENILRVQDISKKCTIFIVGKESDVLLPQLLERVVKEKKYQSTNDTTLISGVFSYETKKTDGNKIIMMKITKELEFKSLKNLSDIDSISNQDRGVIFIGKDKRLEEAPEELVKQHQANSYLFFNAIEPDYTSLTSTNWYVDKNDNDEVRAELLKRFIRDI